MKRYRIVVAAAITAAFCWLLASSLVVAADEKDKVKNQAEGADTAKSAGKDTKEDKEAKDGKDSAPAAGNKGQAELDQAVEQQLNAESLADLEKVVERAEAALQKGLDEENSKFAKQLIASTLVDHARRISEGVLGQQQPNPRWPVLRGLAVRDLDKALLHEPDNAEAHLLRAKLLVLPGGDRKEGLRSANAAVKLLKDEKEQLSEALVARAELTEDEEQRIKDLDAAIDADPGNSDAWQARALHFVAKGDNDKAVKDLVKLLDKKSDNVLARLMLAEVLMNLKKYDEALQQISIALARQPGSPLAFQLRARVYLLQEKPDEALEALGKSIEAEPRDVGALLTRAQVLVEVDKLDAAREDLDRILQLRPGLPQALILRSAVFVDQKKYAESIGDLRELLKKDPANVAIRMQAAQVYTAGGWPRHAIRILSDILKEDPDNGLALRSRGDAYLNIGKHAEAIADFNKAIELQPENSGILNNLAWVLATTPDDKLRDAERSIKLGLKGVRGDRVQGAAHLEYARLGLRGERRLRDCVEVVPQGGRIERRRLEGSTQERARKLRAEEALA
jgi:tetratricopeptide (TPR) repeat protein